MRWEVVAVGGRQARRNYTPSVYTHPPGSRGTWGTEAFTSHCVHNGREEGSLEHFWQQLVPMGLFLCLDGILLLQAGVPKKHHRFILLMIFCCTYDVIHVMVLTVPMEKLFAS